MKTLIKYLVVTLVLMTSASAMRMHGEFVVIVDAGHGGEDAGCVGRKCKEKDVTLDVSKQLAARINKELPGVKALLTRSSDRDVDLSDRAAFANRNNGQLFISIHVNSVEEKSKGRRSVKGAVVYAPGLHVKDLNLRVVKRQRTVVEVEKGGRRVARKHNPKSSESNIAFELAQSENYEESLRFAGMALKHLVKDAGRANKDVLQSGFYVLKYVRMPAVLVELDFMCNPEQEAFLNSAEGRRKCVNALFNAVAEYLK